MSPLKSVSRTWARPSDTALSILTGRLPPRRAVLLQEGPQVLVLVKQVVPVRHHLLDGLLVGPALLLHAVDGAVRAGAVLAGEAVDQHGVVGRVLHDLAEPLDVPGGRHRTVAR